MTLQRLVLTFTAEGVEARVLYRCVATSGAGPSTKARRQEAVQLTREGLEAALEALGGRVDVIGTSGYDVREDTISAEGRTA